MANFRISVCLLRYYNDERSYCFVYIDEKFKIVADLEEYLRKQFRLEKRFCLMIDKNLLPNEETINIIKEDETITVVPRNEDWWKENISDSAEILQNGVAECADVVDSVITEKNSKKKKKKKSKPETEASNSHEDETVPLKKEKNALSENSETESSKKIFSDMDVSMGSEPEKEITLKVGENFDNEENSNNVSLSTNDSSQVPQKITDMQTAIQQLKQKALTLLGEVAIQKQVTGVSGGRINKRKRIRKRNKNSLSVSTPDLTEAVTPPVTFIPVSKATSHIRFDNDASSQNTVRNSEIQSKPRVVRAVESPSAGASRKNSISGSSGLAGCTQADPQPVNGSENHKNVSAKKQPAITVEQVMERLSEFPVMDNVYPVLTDLVMFKMLKMGSDYTPVISNHILGNVLAVDKASDIVKVVVVDGSEECKPVKGKFDLERAEDDSDDELILDVMWSQVSEPRVIFP